MIASPLQNGFGLRLGRNKAERRVSGLRRRGGAMALAVTASLLVAGCATQSDLRFATTMSEVPAAKAVVLPPPGGPAIVAVLQRTYENGVGQEIALATSSMTMGQNTIYVSMIQNPEGPTATENVLKVQPITPDRIQLEMAERLPGIDMRTSLYYVQNRYGPFGFATGRSAAGDLCLYAWQDIQSDKPAILVPGGLISIRLRLCDLDATEEQLLRLMYGFSVSAYFDSSGWDPFGSPPEVPKQLGRLDAPVSPFTLGVTGVAPRAVIVPTARPVPRRVPARPVHKGYLPPEQEAAPAPAEPKGPLEGYPVVPPPP